MDDPMPQDDMVILEPEDCEYYQMPGGILLIGRSDPFVSQGFVDVNPKTELEKKSKPASGLFKQMAGTSVVTTYEDGSAKEKTLNTGDLIQIPSGVEYTIKNPGEGKCVIAWKFDGDCYEIFENMRKQLPKATPESREKSGYKELFEEHQKRNEEKQGDY